MRTIVCLLLLGLLILSSRASQACEPAEMSNFQRFEASALVAHVRVKSIVGRTITFDVVKVVRGAPGSSFRISDYHHGPCDPAFRAGDVGILYLDHKGRFVNAFDSFPSATPELLAELAGYRVVAEPTTRVSALIELAIQTRNPRLATEAAGVLVDDPAALATITNSDRDRLKRALTARKRDEKLVLVLLRLGAPGLEAYLPASSPERLLYLARAFESVTSTQELAKLIAATPKGPSARAAAAFERCERLHRKQLEEFDVTVVAVRYVESDWKQWGDRCRTGQPYDP